MGGRGRGRIGGVEVGGSGGSGRGREGKREVVGETEGGRGRGMECGERGRQWGRERGREWERERGDRVGEREEMRGKMAKNHYANYTLPSMLQIHHSTESTGVPA